MPGIWLPVEGQCLHLTITAKAVLFNAHDTDFRKDTLSMYAGCTVLLDVLDDAYITNGLVTRCVVYAMPEHEELPKRESVPISQLPSVQAVCQSHHVLYAKKPEPHGNYRCGTVRNWML